MKVLEQATAESLQIAPTLRQAATHLRADEYSVVVLDEFNELKGTLTALMLSCELALQAHDLPAAEGKIHQVYELALEMRAKLGITETDESLKAAN